MSDMNDNDVKTPLSEMLVATMDFIENTKGIIAMLEAYRGELVKLGLSETAQEAMLMDVHYALWRGMPQ